MNKTVTLLSPGLDAVFGNGDDVVRTGTTDSTGAFAFENVTPGLYRLSIPLPNVPDVECSPAVDSFSETSGHEWEEPQTGTNTLAVVSGVTVESNFAANHRVSTSLI